MKKVLLLAVMALVAMTSSARIVKNNVQKVADDKMVAGKMMKQEMASRFATVTPAAVAAAASTRAEGDQVNLVMSAVDWLDDEEGTQISVCGNLILVKSGATEEKDGETYEKVTIYGIGGGYGVVEGLMSDSKIIIPSQIAYVDEDYGKMQLKAGYINAAGTALEYSTEDIVLENVDGEWFVNDDHFYGFFLFMLEGPYVGKYFTDMCDQYPSYFAANGVCSYENTNNSGTTEQNAYVFVELGEDDDIYVTNLFGTTIMMFIDEDNQILIPNMQIVGATSSGIDQEVYGYAFYLYNRPEGKNADSDAEFIPASFADDKTIAVGNTSIFSLFDEDGRGYYKGLQGKTKIQLLEGTFPTAIDVIKSYEKKDNAIYNIAGQRVEKAQKGLYIMGGQKVLVK